MPGEGSRDGGAQDQRRAPDAAQETVQDEHRQAQDKGKEDVCAGRPAAGAGDQPDDRRRQGKGDQQQDDSHDAPGEESADLPEEARPRQDEKHQAAQKDRRVERGRPGAGARQDPDEDHRRRADDERQAVPQKNLDEHEQGGDEEHLLQVDEGVAGPGRPDGADDLPEDDDGGDRHGEPLQAQEKPFQGRRPVVEAITEFHEVPL